jgi:phosphohistidine phosphatase
MESSGSTRTLLLLRHAKSSWEAGVEDFDRPLAPRGRRTAPLIGAEMVRRGWIPEQVVCSPARRARETWDLVAGALGPVPPATFEQGAYLAAPAALLRLVRGVAPEVGRLLVVGHNPGLQELALLLASPDSGAPLERLRAKLPTAGLAVLELPAGPWSALAAGSARLRAFVAPRDLE